MKYEKELVAVVTKSFGDQGLIVTTEVPMLSKKIDILCLNTETDDIIAIEAKIGKWRRALQQALTYRLCSDYVYIAIHHKYSHRVQKDLLDKHGVGLIVVNDDSIEIPLDPSQSTVMNQKMKDDVLTYVGGELPVAI